MYSPNSFELTDSKTQLEENASISIESKETTNWRLIIVTGIVSCLIAVENSVLGMGEWPYMKEIDDEASAQFFGASQSAAKCSHAIFALVFSIWSYKIKSIRYPMIVSRIIAIAACALYLSVEYVPDDKRYAMMSVYILLGLSNSACTILRGYIVMCSTSEDRARAFAVIGLSVIVAIVLGPLLQLIFSGVAYPGVEVLPGIRFHVYSAPIWISLIFTIATTFVIWFFMTDVHPVSSEQSETAHLNFLEKIKHNFTTLRNSNLNWKLISVCLTVKIGATFLNAILGSIMSLIFMVQYGWTGTETVQIGSSVMVAFGLISCSFLLLYVFSRFGAKLPQEWIFLVCIFASAFFFVITYPFPFNSQENAPYNTSNHAGCNPKEYSWCETSKAVDPYFLGIGIVAIFAPSIPLMATSLDTVYSRVLGNIDQNVAHGVMTIVDDLIFMITPIFTTSVFAFFGPGPLWIMNATLFTVLALIWIWNLKELGQAT